MAESSRFWEGNSELGVGVGDVGPYDGDQMAAVFGALVNGRSGVLSGLAVSESSPAAKSVTIAAGQGIINPGNPLARGLFYENDADLIETIADNTSGNPRIDRVVLRCDWTNQRVRIEIKQGTPAASPSAPGLTQTNGVLWEESLAQIAVANSFSTITTSDITAETPSAIMAFLELDDTPSSYVAESVLRVNAAGDAVEAILPPNAEYTADESSDYTTNSTSWVDVDATNFVLTITTQGGPVLIGFDGNVACNHVSNSVYFDVDIDGTRLGGDDGLKRIANPDAATANRLMPVEFHRLVNLAAGEHTFTLQWKNTATSSFTTTLYAGAGTSGADLHPQFFVVELLGS